MGEPVSGQVCCQASCHALRDGRLVAAVAGRFLYTFLADSELDLPNDSPVQLVVGPGAAYEATVVSVQGFDVTLAVPRNLGDRMGNHPAN